MPSSRATLSFHISYSPTADRPPQTNKKEEVRGPSKERARSKWSSHWTCERIVLSCLGSVYRTRTRRVDLRMSKATSCHLCWENEKYRVGVRVPERSVSVLNFQANCFRLRFFVSVLPSFPSVSLETVCFSPHISPHYFSPLFQTTNTTQDLNADRFRRTI